MATNLFLRAARRLRKGLLLATGAILFCASNGVAEQATFSADGKHVYYLDFSGEKPDVPAVIDVEVATGKSAPLVLPGSLSAQAKLSSISRSKSGFLLLLYRTALWAYDPVKNTAAKVCAAEPGNEFYDLTCDATNGRIFIDSKNALLYLDKGESDAKMVQVRRVDRFHALTMLTSGHLLFDCGGDAWLGRVDFEKLDGNDMEVTLVGHRFAPLATLETGNYSPAAHGVEELAVSNKWVYVYMARMGGSGEGAVLRLARPDPASIDAFDASEIKTDAQAAAQELSTVEALGSGVTGAASLCCSPDGTTVFFRGSVDKSNDSAFLITDTGKPTPLPAAK